MTFEEILESIQTQLDERNMESRIDGALLPDPNDAEDNDLRTDVSDVPSSKIVKCSSTLCKFINDEKCLREGVVSITESGRCMNYSPVNRTNAPKEFISPIDSVEI